MCLRVLSKTLIEFWQARCYDQFPQEPVPVSKHLLGAKPFPDIQSEPPLRFTYVQIITLAEK